MADVKHLLVVGRPINLSVIELLEDALDRARAGEVMAVAVVEVCPQREVSTAWARDGHYHELNSGCARLAALMAAETD